ncbi:MAG TPA: DUF5686 family protein, partial [Bacteroidia bacterium]|nr:DUF5686 family protein [Bacteroidia bacterium]
NLTKKAQTLFIKRNKKQRLTIELEKIHFNTKDNVSQKEKDYVLQLLDSVMAHKEQNNNSSLKKYCWEMYDKFQIYLGNYSSEIKELGAFQKHNHLFKYTDTINGHPLIPIYMSESIYKKFVDRSLSLNEQILIARKSTGKNYENLTTMTDKLLENINVYEDYFQILDKSFVSPLVTNYSLFYKYKLIGKTVLKKNIFYSIQFEPYRKEDFAFSGTLLIDGKTWAIKKVDMETAESINLNYVKTLHIQQKYKFIQNKWIVNKFETWATLSALKWQKGEDLIVHRYTSFEDIIIDNSQVIKKEYTAALINRTHGEEIQSELFWKRNRHKTLGKKEKYNYAIADTINHVPFIEKAKRISTIAISGYMELGKISLYQLNTFYSINPIENHRIKFGLITNKYFSEKLQLQGYIAYGTGDKAIKYKGGVLYVLNKSVDRLLLGATYKYDLELSGVSPSHIPFDNVITSFTSINKKVKLIFAREARIFIEKEWIKGVSSKLTFVNKEMRPLGDITFEKNIENSVIPKQIHDITISEIQIHSRFSYKEKFYINEFKRISLGSRYPIFRVDLILGAKNILHSNYSYQKIKTNVLGKFYINPFGYIYYNLEGGKIMGTVPFLLATLHPANQSLAYDVEGFNAMRYFEFASDTYASLFLDHHFDGFFLNKIPLVKKAKLREVVSARGVIGTLSTKNKEEMVLPEGMSDVRKPYVEYSIGIENILKVLRVEYIWRGTHMSPVTRSDNWAIKARFFLAF